MSLKYMFEIYGYYKSKILDPSIYLFFPSICLYMKFSFLIFNDYEQYLKIRRFLSFMIRALVASDGVSELAKQNEKAVAVLLLPVRVSRRFPSSQMEG